MPSKRNKKKGMKIEWEEMEKMRGKWNARR
jgi:hypothetical protein